MAKILTYYDKQKTWYIYGKGYSNCMETDGGTGLEYADIKFGSGFILFTGTEDELNNYLLTFRDNDFKVRGVFVYNSTEFLMWKHGPYYDATKDENIKPSGENINVLQ